MNPAERCFVFFKAETRIKNTEGFFKLFFLAIHIKPVASMKFSANDFQSEFNTSIQAWQQLSLVWEPLITPTL